jgi:hypothetical protein
MSRSPARPHRSGSPSGSRSPPERVEEFCWSHRHSTIAIGPATSPVPLRTPVSCHPPPPNRVTCAGPCEPSRRPDPVDPPGRVSSRCSHAGFPQGFLTRRILTFVSLCLADEYHRPNCQRIRPDPVPTIRLEGRFAGIGSRASPHSHSLDAIGRSESPLSNSLRPSFDHRVCS